MDRIVGRVGSELRAVPGVRDVGGHVGRAILADQIVGVDSGEIWLALDPGADYDRTIDDVQRVVTRLSGPPHASCARTRRIASPRSSRLRPPTSSSASTGSDSTCSGNRPRRFAGACPASPTSPRPRSATRPRSRPSRSRSTSPTPSGTDSSRATCGGAPTTMLSGHRGRQPVRGPEGLRRRRLERAGRPQGPRDDQRPDDRSPDGRTGPTRRRCERDDRADPGGRSSRGRIPLHRRRPRTSAAATWRRRSTRPGGDQVGADAARVSSRGARRLRHPPRDPGPAPDGRRRGRDPDPPAVAGGLRELAARGADLRDAARGVLGGALAAEAAGGLSLGTILGFFTVLAITARSGILLVREFQRLERTGELTGRALILHAASERLVPLLATVWRRWPRSFPSSCSATARGTR